MDQGTSRNPPDQNNPGQMLPKSASRPFSTQRTLTKIENRPGKIPNPKKERDVTRSFKFPPRCASCARPPRTAGPKNPCPGTPNKDPRSHRKSEKKKPYIFSSLMRECCPSGELGFPCTKKGTSIKPKKKHGRFFRTEGGWSGRGL